MRETFSDIQILVHGENQVAGRTVAKSRVAGIRSCQFLRKSRRIRAFSNLKLAFLRKSCAVFFCTKCVCKALFLLCERTGCGVSDLLDLSSEDPRIMVGSWSDHDRSVFLLAEAMKGFFDQFLNLHFLRKSCKIRTFSYLGLLLLLLF